MEYVICHYGEIALKGRNRKYFEEVLVDNIKRSLPEKSFEFVKRISGRILIRLNKKGAENKGKVKASLKNVFGIVYFSFALNCSQDMESIKKTAKELLSKKKFKTFKIETKRSKKEFHLTSQEINEKIGELILKSLGKKVNLGKPGITLFIEIVQDYAFFYLSKIRGLGGLPVGVSGKAVGLISGGIDSPVAAFLSMKRGLKVVFVHFHAHPYTGKESIDKVKRLVGVLNDFQIKSVLYLVPFASIQKEIVLKAPSRLRVILYRRLMLEIATNILKKEKCRALITGDSLGQVASQTIENIGVVNKAVDYLVIRPLIGYDKQEIIEKAKEIGTYKISILPHKDCCSRFLPRNPATKAGIKEVEAAEEKLNKKDLIKKAGESIIKLIIKHED